MNSCVQRGGIIISSHDLHFNMCKIRIIIEKFNYSNTVTCRRELTTLIDFVCLYYMCKKNFSIRGTFFRLFFFNLSAMHASPPPVAPLFFVSLYVCACV